MDDDNELPEYQIFSILRQGEEQPIGPYSQNQIVRLLNEGAIRPHDLVYYDDIGEWRPLREVFEIHEGISNFVDEGQDKAVVGEIFRAIQQLFGDDVPVYYIAVQERGPLGIGGTEAVALTNSRIFVARHKQGRVELEAYLWSHISGTHMSRKPNHPTGTFRVDLYSGSHLDIDRIPQAQLERLDQISREVRSAT